MPDVLQRWFAAINARDVSALSSLMAPDFVFVDSLGNEVRGAETMTAGWRAYFTMCPDYWIRIRDSAPTPDATLMTGDAGGTIDGTPWHVPAAWRIVIRDGQVAEFRVFADNKPVYDILARRSREGNRP
jgi:ketosteroid isomerase-like protein